MHTLDITVSHVLSVFLECLFHIIFAEKFNVAFTARTTTSSKRHVNSFLSIYNFALCDNKKQ